MRCRSFRENWYLIMLWLLGGTLLCTDSFAQRWVTYSTPHGLVNGNICDILLDQNGELWFATVKGVSKFNGEWFAFRTEEGLVHNTVASIVQDMDGNIWFGTEGGISKIEPTSDLNNPANWQNYTVNNTDGGLANDYVTAIVIDREGNLWFGTNGGGISVADPTPGFTELSKDPLLDPENWKTYTKDDGLTGNNIFRFDSPLDQLMTIDAIGNTWVIAGINFINIYEIESREWENFSLQNPDIKSPTVLFKDRDGNVWIGTNGYGVYKVYPNNLTSYDEHYTVTNTQGGLASNTIMAIAQDNTGALWFGHNQEGVSLVLPDSALTDSTNWEQFTTLDGLGYFFVGAIIEDEEENVWFGHNQARGVSQLDRSWQSFLLQKDFDNKVLFLDNQRFLWIKIAEGVVRVNLDANLMLEKNFDNVFTNSSGLSSNRIFTVFQDSRNSFWFGTGEGADRVAAKDLHNPDQWISFNSSNGFGFDVVAWITEDRLGYLWLAAKLSGDKILYRVHVDSTENVDSWLSITESSGITSVNVIIPAKNGNLWFATDKGVSVFDPALDPKDSTNWQNYDRENGLVHNVVLSIFEDMDGYIWFATEGGVSRIDPNTNLADPSNWINYTKENTQNGLAGNFVTSITQFEEDEFWFGTLVGANKFELNSNRWTLYTTSDGLQSNRIHSLFTDRVRKEIWFGTFGGGVTRYKPKTKPPKTILENNLDIVTQNQVTFKFRGADIITPKEELRFFYKLDSQDLIETSDNFATVFVEDSDRPKRHVFEVRAIDRDGNIDPSPATDVFYKIKSEFGGNVVFSDDDEKTKAELFIPPGEVLKDTAIFIEPVKRLELSESNVIAAYRLSSEPDGMRFKNRATLRISFLDEKINSTSDLMIFLRDDDAWKPIGGRVKRDGDTLSVTTSIQEFGVYAVRSDRVNIDTSAQPLSVQPRVISPKTPNKGFGAEATISFHLKDPSTVDVKIYDVAGRLVKEVVISEQMLPGINSVIWDGTDRDQQPVRSGLYVVLVKANTKSDPETTTIVVSNSFR